MLAGGYFWFSDKNEKSETPKLEEKSPYEINKETIVKSYVEKYRVNTEVKIDNLIYSYQLEDALVKSNEPIIFTGSLDDVFRKNGKLYAKYSPNFFDFAEQQIFYTLDGCDEQLMQISSKPEDRWGEYIVVGKISNISKPSIQINASPINNEEAEIELSESETFLATGTCLDVTYLEGEDLK